MKNQLFSLLFPSAFHFYYRLNRPLRIMASLTAAKRLESFQRSILILVIHPLGQIVLSFLFFSFLFFFFRHSLARLG
ncbi:hypothetical protein BDV28DRAFT_15297 [Aspergillus coremiiformis]|uniref:Uncharacterized protein n=1 Tax=Aspergillus coremiiformis TaxID=138285 RepID=A0A5N6Z405_9EURO|nr:hypothetical protein BDV28DRAFT_15297 [Aspergillus coremiiformis]